MATLCSIATKYDDFDQSPFWYAVTSELYETLLEDLGSDATIRHLLPDCSESSKQLKFKLQQLKTFTVLT